MTHGDNEALTVPKLQLTAKCGCGGNMIPHPRKKLIWICDRSHWWNRKKHAYLKFDVQLPNLGDGGVILACESCGQKYGVMEDEIPASCPKCQGKLRMIQ